MFPNGPGHRDPQASVAPRPPRLGGSPCPTPPPPYPTASPSHGSCPWPASRTATAAPSPATCAAVTPVRSSAPNTTETPTSATWPPPALSRRAVLGAARGAGGRGRRRVPAPAATLRPTGAAAAPASTAARRPAVHSDRAGRHHRRRRDGAVRLPLGRRSSGGATRSCAGAPAVRRRRPDPERAGRPVRLQLRLPRHHRDQPRGHPRAARGQPRVHQREHHVPARHRPRRASSALRGPRTGCPWWSSTPAPARRPGATSRGAASTAGSPWTPSSPSTVPAAGSDAAQDRRGPDRAQGARHDEQLRRRHHAVGHRAVRRGELQPVLPRRRHRPEEERYGLGRTQDTRNWRSVDPRWDATAGLPERAQPVRLDRRGRPRRPDVDPGQAHRDGPVQARGRQRHHQRRRPGRRLHG